MISVVLATHNEEKNLASCLDSVKNWVSEIVIVDGESSDNTIKIAKKYNAKIIQTTNKPNFHINKQMGIDKATHNLILQLDADEHVDQDLADFIKKIDKKLDKNLDGTSLRKYLESDQPKGWWIKRKNFFLGRFLSKGGQYPDPVIRLFIKGFGSLPQKDVHEQIEIKGKVGWAQGHLLHYSNPSFADYLRKFNTYTSFSALKLSEKKQDLNFLFIIKSLLLDPIKIFFSLFIRHKGFVDKTAGFIFALMSSLHPPIVLIKLWEKNIANKNVNL